LSRPFNWLPDPVARADVVADVGPVEPGDDHPLLGDPQLDQYVGPRALVGGCGQRQPRYVATLVEQWQQQPVIGPEIMPPFADAMRLVDCDQRQHFLVDQLAETIGRRPLRRHVQQVEVAIAEPLDRLPPVGIGRSQRRRLDAITFRRPDLVVHQRESVAR
jgi:hypothetical protein